MKYDNKVDVKKAYEFLKGYCTEKGYNFNKLVQYKWPGVNVLTFAKPKDILSRGLIDDIASQPYPILFVQQKGDDFFVEETEFTEKYIKE